MRRLRAELPELGHAKPPCQGRRRDPGAGSRKRVIDQQSGKKAGREGWPPGLPDSRTNLVSRRQASRWPQNKSTEIGEALFAVVGATAESAQTRMLIHPPGSLGKSESRV